MPGRPPFSEKVASVWSNSRLWYVLTTGYAALVALASLLPGNRLPTIPDWSRLFSPDKVAHFGVYAIFALLLSVCFSERGKTRTTVIAFSVAAGFGALMEILQGISGTGRQADVVDMVANALGALLGIAIWLLLQQLKNWFRDRPEPSE